MKIPATVPYFSENDMKFIQEKFSSILNAESFLSMYKYGEEFEKSFSSYIGTNYAVACNSGTSALELIFRSIDVKDKEVILPSNTFLATVIAVLNAGGIPVFADCDDDMCIDFNDACSKVTKNTGSIVIVHIGGIISKSIFKLRDFCEENNIFLVEDAAQAHGSSYKGIKAGNFGVAAGFSFFSTKVMTTGEGGMVTTNSFELSKQMKSMREFGKVKKGIITNYHQYFGYNWRMPEVSALMGITQLNRLDAFVKRRQEIAKIYNEELENFSEISIVSPPSFTDHNFFKYIVILDNHDREEIHQKMQELGISPSGYVYEIPLHKQPVLSEFENLDLPKTDYLCSKHFCLPIYYSLTNQQAKKVVTTFKSILES